MSDYWGELPKSAREALLRAAEHVDGMALAGSRTVQLLVKRGLAESYGRTRICITDKGLRSLKNRSWDTCAFRNEYDPVTLEPLGKACGRVAVAIICWHDGRRSPMCERHGTPALTPEARKLVAHVEQLTGREE